MVCGGEQRRQGAAEGKRPAGAVVEEEPAKKVWCRCDTCQITTWVVPPSRCCCGGTMLQPPKAKL